ncbi:hypothetical protein Dimus_036650 [Dionaea muscipula]
MGSFSANKLFLLRRLTTLLRVLPSASVPIPSLSCPLYLLESPRAFGICPCTLSSSPSFVTRNLCSRPLDIEVPASRDYSSTLQEEEFHMLADSTIHDLLEKLEEYGDSIQIDGFDIEYGNQVLTLKLGDLGTYVLNKQTPNRQIWLSSPVSGPARFDWDSKTEAWVYRRNGATLFRVVESELEQLCGESISLS